MKKSFDLQFMEVLDARCDIGRKGKWYLELQKTGHRGQEEFLQILLANIPRDWQIITNRIYSTRFNTKEIDVILVTPNFICVFEVKNLNSNYEFRDNRWTANGREIESDFFDEIKTALKVARKIVRQENIPIEVIGRLVFVNEQDTVTIEGENHLYLKRWHLVSFIDKLKQINHNSNFNVSYLMEALTINSNAPTPTERKPWAVDANTHNGIICKNCQNHEVNSNAKTYYVVCPRCHFAEVKEIAVLRTICELGILYYDRPLTRRFINECLDDINLQHVVSRLLTKYFKLKQNGRTAAYHNPTQIIDYEFEEVIKTRRYKDHFIE